MPFREGSGAIAGLLGTRTHGGEDEELHLGASTNGGAVFILGMDRQRSPAARELRRCSRGYGRTGGREGNVTESDDDLPLEWVAEPGEEIEVLTADFCDHFGGCANCPGIAAPKELGLTRTQNTPSSAHTGTIRRQPRFDMPCRRRGRALRSETTANPRFESRRLQFRLSLPILGRQRTCSRLNECIGLIPTIEPKLPYCRPTQLITADYARNRRGDSCSR